MWPKPSCGPGLPAGLCGCPFGFGFGCRPTPNKQMVCPKENWAWLRIKQPGQTAGFSLLFHGKWVPFWGPVKFDPQPNGSLSRTNGCGSENGSSKIKMGWSENGSPKMGGSDKGSSKMGCNGEWKHCVEPAVQNAWCFVPLDPYPNPIPSFWG